MIKFLFFCFLIFPLFSGEIKLPWIVYYNQEAPEGAFDIYNPIIFEVQDHPSLEPLLKKKKEVLGYLNLGEAEEYRSWFWEVKNEKLLIEENPDWPGSWSIDIRKSAWKRLILDKIIPHIFQQGFTGLFLDQLDIVIALEKKDPEKNHGMISALIDLIYSIREKYPNKRLMMNRGFEILSDVGKIIDYELIETLYTSYNFQTKKYYARSEKEYEWGLAQINNAKQLFPHITFFSLDYWDPSDQKMIAKIYKVERSACLRPYVSTISLDKIIPEPSS